MNPFPASKARSLLGLAAAAALVLVAPSSPAREFDDASEDFQIELVERGAACVLAPPARYDPHECAGVTPMRPVASSSSSVVPVIGAIVVHADGWTYSFDLLREKRSGTPELRPADAELVASGFVAKMQPSLKEAGVTVRREGAAELSRASGVQVLVFEARVDAPGSLMADLDCTEYALILADGFTYTVEVHGPSTRSNDLREILHASLATLHATPPRHSHVYNVWIAVARWAALVFVAALVTAGIVVSLRRTRASRS